MALPQVSVVVPMYNHQAYVRDALLSIESQSYDRIEAIAVDDGSSDRTPEIAESVLRGMRGDHRLVRQPNQGAHAALNHGVGIARGEYVAILNSDDLFEPDRVARLVAEAARRGSRFLYSQVRHIDGHGAPLPATSPAVSSYQESLAMMERFPTPSFELLRTNVALTSGNLFFARSLFEEVGGFRDFPICHDWDFILRALILEEPVFIPEVLLRYRLHGANTILQADQGRRAAETEAILRNYVATTDAPKNRLAPCRRNWGEYWDHFVQMHLQHHAFLSEQIPAVGAAGRHLGQDEAQYDRGTSDGPRPPMRGLAAEAGTVGSLRTASDAGHASSPQGGPARAEGTIPAPPKEQMLADLAARLDRAILDEQRRQLPLQDKIAQLEELLSVSKLPPLPARVYFYFAFRKLLFPLYRFLGGDATGWLRSWKLAIRRKLVKPKDL